MGDRIPLLRVNEAWEEDRISEEENRSIVANLESMSQAIIMLVFPSTMQHLNRRRQVTNQPPKYKLKVKLFRKLLSVKCAGK